MKTLIVLLFLAINLQGQEIDTVKCLMIVKDSTKAYHLTRGYSVEYCPLAAPIDHRSKHLYFLDKKMIRIKRGRVLIALI